MTRARVDLLEKLSHEAPAGRPGCVRSRARIRLFAPTRTQRHIVGRIQVGPDDVGQLLNEGRVFRQLEHRDAARLQAVRVPDALDGRAAHARGLGHRATTPVGGARRLLQRGMHDGISNALARVTTR